MLLPVLLLVVLHSCNGMKIGRPPIVYQLPTEVNQLLGSYLSSNDNRTKSWIVLFYESENFKINLLELPLEENEGPSISNLAKKTNRFLDVDGRHFPIIFYSDLVFSLDWNIENHNGFITSAFLFGGGFYIEFDGRFKSGKVISYGIDL